MASNTRPPKARALGAAIRDEREQQGMSLRKLAIAIGKDPSQVSRWETGERAPKPTDVAQMLAVIGVNGDRYDEIIAMADGTDEPRWVAVTLPEYRQQFAALLDFERAATSITEVHPNLIPGLLQTSCYTRAMMVDGGVPASEIETRVAIRMGRREAIIRRAPDPIPYTALTCEAALRQVIGGRAAMAEQLRFLLYMAERSNVDLRVIGFDTGWHPALEGASLLIESATLPVVQLENRRSMLFLHEPADVEIYRESATTLMNVAMSPEESARCIAKIADEMDVSR